tara:strand:+ start:8582 stop:10186 length:1605 start_codon:yes stop_codon:yes gene_type:complete
MTLNFPSSPTNGQTYSLANGATYTWDGEKWKASNIPDSSDVVQTVDTPSSGEFLKWNGSAAVWDADNNTTYSTVSTSAAGLAPTLPASHGGKFLRGDGTWVVPPDTDTTYSVGDGGLTQKNFTTTLKTKLDGIETNADVTDATNVAAAGAVMESDTTTASMSFVVDEDNMSSNSNTKVPTQQSVKAYVDNNAGGGGLTEFTEADHETSPNSTYHVSSLTSNAGSTNADVAIVPKGDGSLLAAVPDSAAAGGNKRGSNSVDLQTDRSFADHVCGSNYSVLSGGTGNKIGTGGGNNVIAGGYGNEIDSGEYNSAICGGRMHDVVGSYATVLGGSGAYTADNSLAFGSGSASGYSAICLGDHTASTDYSTCIGGYRGDSKGRTGVFVIPAGKNSNFGDAQYQIQNVKRQTTDATQTTLNADTQTSSSSVWNTFRLAVNQMHVIKGTCVAAKSDYSLAKAWDFTAVVKWENGTNAPVIVGTPNINVLMEETNSSTWDISLDILTYSTAIASFVVKVTGQASTTIDWLCTLHSTELNTL